MAKVSELRANTALTANTTDQLPTRGQMRMDDLVLLNNLYSRNMTAGTASHYNRYDLARHKESAMYARLVRFSFGPGKHAQAQSIADDIAPLIGSQPGCASVTVFGDDTERRIRNIRSLGLRGRRQRRSPGGSPQTKRAFRGEYSGYPGRPPLQSAVLGYRFFSQHLKRNQDGLRGSPTG